jgi:hypothetical protein
MNFWTVPIAAVIATATAILFLGLAGRKVQSVAYDIADRLMLKDGSGVSKRNLESFTARIVPGWSKALGWGASFASLGVLVYVGIRFGWLWAIGYAVTDHLLKTVGVPTLPTTAQIHRVLLSKARKTAPKIAPYMKDLLETGISDAAPGS